MGHEFMLVWPLEGSSNWCPIGSGEERVGALPASWQR